MRVAREAISVALFNLLDQDPTLKKLCRSITRTVKMWPDVPTAQRPWLMLFKGGPGAEAYQQPQDQRLALTKYIITYNLWLYVTSEPLSTTVPVETVVNQIADAIDAAMQGPPTPQGQQANIGDRQTLGGLVNNAWIEGPSEWGREFEDQNVVVMWRIQVETGI